MKLSAQGEAPRNEWLSNLLKIYNERGARQADTVLQPILQNQDTKVLSDLDFAIRSELGDASNPTAGTATTVT